MCRSDPTCVRKELCRVQIPPGNTTRIVHVKSIWDMSDSDVSDVGTNDSFIAFIAGLCAGQEPARGCGQEVVQSHELSWVESGRIGSGGFQSIADPIGSGQRSSNFSRAGSGQEIFKYSE